MAAPRRKDPSSLWRGRHNRKNWLFAGSPAGGRRAAALYTLIGSAKLAGVDPLAYLTDVIGRLATTPVSQVRELTPLRWKAVRAAEA